MNDKPIIKIKNIFFIKKILNNINRRIQKKIKILKENIEKGFKNTFFSQLKMM